MKFNYIIILFVLSLTTKAQTLNSDADKTTSEVVILYSNGELVAEETTKIFVSAVSFDETTMGENTSISSSNNGISEIRLKIIDLDNPQEGTQINFKVKKLYGTTLDFEYKDRLYELTVRKNKSTLKAKGQDLKVFESNKFMNSESLDNKGIKMSIVQQTCKNHKPSHPNSKYLKKADCVFGGS